ncbi:alkaline phosphatase family protein [Myxococcota bacterium]|nr:alkaline phosphatase family protein [Myxococcota bacterium]
MKRLLGTLFAPSPVIPSMWLLLTGLLTLVSVDHVIRERRLPPHPYVLATPDIQRKMETEQLPPESRVFIYFIDSLRFDYAITPELMPNLSRLLPQSTWGEVTPCATSMTVHCVEAAFSGIDRSTVLAFGEDFNPQKSKHKTAWFFQMKNRGAHIAAVTDYVIPTLYKDALAENHVYKKGASQKKLVDRALGYFANPKNTVTIVHLLGPHDDGQTYGSNTPQYRAQLKEVDDLLGEVVAALKPTDTLMIMGDHGMDDEGRHMYNMVVPTFYLYRGPEFTPNLRRDIHLLSHTFFLSVMFRLPFHPSYQGEFFWEAVSEPVRKQYGPEEARALHRPVEPGDLTISTEYRIRFGLLILLWILGFRLLFHKAPAVPNRFGVPWAVASVVALYMGWFWPLVAALAGMAAFLMRGAWRTWTVWILGGLVFAWGVSRGLVYRPFDLAMHEVKIHFIYMFFLLELGAGFLLYGHMFGPARWRERLWGGSLLAMAIAPFLHFPSLYAYGFLRTTPFFLSVHLAATAMWFSGPDFNRRPWKEMLPLLSLPVVAALLLLPQYSIFVENFRIFDFPLLPHREGSGWNMVYALVPFALSTFFAVRQTHLRREKLIWILPAFLLTPAFLLLGHHLSPFVFAGLFWGLLALWFLPSRWFPGGCKWLLTFFWTQWLLSYMFIFSLQAFYQIHLLFLCAFALLEASRFIAAHKPDRPYGLIVIPAVALILLSFTAFFSIRTCGIDFRFGLAWFPDLFETLWFLVFGATLVKYFSPVFLIKALETSQCRELAMPRMLRWGTFLAWTVMPLMLTLLFISEKVPLVVDTLEEGMYLLGVSLTLLITEALPVGSFRVAGLSRAACSSPTEVEPPAGVESPTTPPAVDESLT